MALLRAIRRPIARLVLVTFTLSPYGALAGATPDSNAASQNQASVTHAGTVPVVNIVAPDAGGLSHNKWQQFDVSPQGMVLNNATAATHTTLAGTLGANPNLAGGAARVILNEVTSNQPSSLLGTLEVAGQSARVIIANPNGITCNGCGFINTPHVQLTTGRPGFDNGALRFDVTGGQIDIGANGLSVLATRLDLIAHTLRTQGAINTQADLNLIAGRFYAHADTLVLSGAGRSGVGPFPHSTASYAIDIGQSVAADSIQLIASGSDIGVRTAAPVGAFADLTIASRETLALGGTLTAGRDIGIYNTGAWGSVMTGQITAQRDLQIIAMDLSVAASGLLRTMAGNIELGFIGDNADAHTQLINYGTVAAAGDLIFGSVLTGLNTGTLSAGGTMDAVLSSVSPKAAAAGLPGAFGETFYAQFGAGPGAQLANTGTIAAGQDLYFNLIENDGGSLSAGRDAFVWQAQRGQFAGAYQTPQHRAGSVSTSRDLFVFAPGDRNEFTSPGTQSFNAAGNLYLLPEADRFNPPSDLRTALLADLGAPSPSGTARYINRDIFDATGDLSITLPAGFENQKTLHGRDIHISATEVINTAQIDTHHEVVRYQGAPICDGSNAGNCVPIMFAPNSPEPYPGCKTNYTGACTTDTEVVAGTALIDADRNFVIDSPVFRNAGATVLAGGNIDIATNDFFNGQRDYQARWSAAYTDRQFFLLDSGNTCTSNCEASIDWSRTAAGTVPLGSIAGNIQAGNVFSVDTLPRSGQPAIVGNLDNSAASTSGTSNTSPPPASAPSVVATLARAITQGSGSVDAAPPALSKFINTGNINAAAIVVKADDIRNGFDTVKNYYQRTGAPQLPPSTITVANYGTAGILGAGGYSGAALMQVLPSNLASSAPFALTPAEEQAALRNAFLATTGRAWILPGLTWDATTGQSPEQQQHAILAANGAAFAIEHGIPVGGALTPAQQAALGAPVLWYVNHGGALTPVVYLPAAWQQQLINLPGGKLDGEVAIALSGERIDNTGFVLSDGLLAIDAEELQNQKRNAHYYEKREVKGGTLTIWGDTVQGGGLMQAAQWALNADSVYSRSGEFIVAGADAAETAALTSAFEAEIRAELGEGFVFEEAHDNLQTRYKAKSSGFGGLLGAVVTVAASIIAGPTISTLIGNIAGAAAGTTFAAAAGTTAAGLGNMAIGSFVTGTLSNAVGQSVATGRVDWNGALKSGAVSGFTAGLTNAPLFDGRSLNQMASVGTLSGTGQSVADGASGIDATRFAGLAGRAVVNGGVSSAIYGTSFADALRNSLVNDLAAFGANDIGDGNYGKEGTIGHLLAHGVLGAMAEAARGGDALAGAVGAMGSVLAAPLADGMTDLTGTDRQAFVTAMSMLAGGYVAEALGRDGQAAAGAAQNAVVNNYLNHAESEEKNALTEKCGRGGSGCSYMEYVRLQELDQLDRARDALLFYACANPSGSACATELARLTAARDSFAGEDVQTGSRAQKEQAWINEELTRYDARVANSDAYNTGAALIEITGDSVVGLATLASLSAQAALGDETAQVQLGKIAKDIGNFIEAPADTIERHISTTLAQADVLETQGRTDQAQRLRTRMFTEGFLAITGTGALIVKGSGKLIAYVRSEPNLGKLPASGTMSAVDGELVGNSAELPGPVSTPTPAVSGVTANAATSWLLRGEVATSSNSEGIGKILGNYSAVKQGPLTDNLAETFSGGRYTVVELANDTVLYRAGESGTPLGQFFSAESPTGVIQSRIDKAILPVWPGGASSPVDSVFAVSIPAGTKVYVGEVGSQGGFYVGGTQQIVVPKPWAIEGVEILESSPLK